jgi:hypothetical protein
MKDCFSHLESVEFLQGLAMDIERMDEKERHYQIEHIKQLEKENECNHLWLKIVKCLLNKPDGTSRALAFTEKELRSGVPDNGNTNNIIIFPTQKPAGKKNCIKKCWEINSCSASRLEIACNAFELKKNCWEVEGTLCKLNNSKYICTRCEVYKLHERDIMSAANLS